ncbi:hypothetical protein EC968_009794 [Mortierella alpina]|nr:hypothetical protein EC968_009794 [Mortierella alpina]
MKILAITTIKCILPFFLLMSQVGACLPEEDKVRLLIAPVRKALESACKVTKIGGAKDMDWFKTKIVPYYINKEFLTIDPPAGLKKELYKIQKTCHKDTYDYCNKADRDQAAKCVKSMAPGLILKYAAKMSYCPIIDKIVEDWSRVHQNRFEAFVTHLCKRRGVLC